MISDIVELAELIYVASLSPINEEREQKWEILNQLSENVNSFICLCQEGIDSDKIEEKKKRLILICVMNYLEKERWLKLSEEVANRLRESCFNAIYFSEEIKEVSSELIAKIFLLDYQEKKIQEDGLNSIVENIRHQNLEIQKFALQTFYYICENLFYSKNFLLDNETKLKILKGLIYAFDINYEEEKMVRKTVVCLGYSLAYLQEKLEDEDVKDSFFNYLLETLGRFFEKAQYEIVCVVINCLEELSRKVYNQLGKYKNIVFDKVLNCFRSKHSKVVLALNEYFRTMLKCEKKQKMDFFQEFWKDLANYCLEYLLDNYEIEIDSTNGLSLWESLFLLLNDLNRNFIDNTKTTLITFVYDYIEKEDIKIKIISLIVFESLLENLDYEEIKEDLINGFGGLMIFLSSSDVSLILQTLKFLQRMVEFHYPVLQVDDYLNNLIQKLLIILKKSDSIEIKDSVLKILEMVGMNFEEDKMDYKLMDFIFDAIYETMEDLSDLFYIDDCLTTFFTFLSQIHNPSILHDYYKNFHSMLIRSFDKFGKGDLHLFYLEGYLSILCVILNNLNNENEIDMMVLFESDFYIFQEEFDFLKKMNMEYDQIIENSVFFQATVVSLFGPEFEKDVEFFVAKEINQCFRYKNNKTIFGEGLDSFLIIFKKFPQKCCIFVDDKFYFFLKCLNDADFDIELKNNLLIFFINLLFSYKTFTYNINTFLNSINFFIKDVLVSLEGSPADLDFDFYLNLIKTIFDLFDSIFMTLYFNKIYNHDFFLIESFILDFFRYLEKFSEMGLLENQDLVVFLELISVNYHKIKDKINQDFIKKTIIQLDSLSLEKKLFEKFEYAKNAILVNEKIN